jgi:hypothetical protein
VNESTTCTICARELWEDEAGRYACKPCQRRLDDHLAAIAGPAGLYARLCLRLEPGARTPDTRVSGGSGGAPIPADLTVLDLTANGGLVSTLEAWVADWASYGLAATGTGGRLQHRVDQAVATLRLNLPRAVDRHPALDECAREIRDVHRTCAALVDGGRPPGTVSGTCLECGHAIRYGLFDPSADCHHCGRVHTRAELLQPARTEVDAA